MANGPGHPDDSVVSGARALVCRMLRDLGKATDVLGAFWAGYMLTAAVNHLWVDPWLSVVGGGIFAAVVVVCHSWSRV